MSQIESKTIQLIRDVLAAIREDEFVGLGLVFYSTIEGLPILPLCDEGLPSSDLGLAGQIAACSRRTGAVHDGFHLVSSDWILTRRNQYFAPFPKVETKGRFACPKGAGARYLSAWIGSEIENVVCTAVVDSNHQLTLFMNGARRD